MRNQCGDQDLQTHSLFTGSRIHELSVPRLRTDFPASTLVPTNPLYELRYADKRLEERGSRGAACGRFGRA